MKNINLFENPSCQQLQIQGNTQKHIFKLSQKEKTVSDKLEEEASPEGDALQLLLISTIDPPLPLLTVAKILDLNKQAGPSIEF